MASSYPGPERRQHKRVEVNFTLVYQVDKPLTFRMTIGSRKIDALMLDLSESGMSILTVYNLPISAILLMRLTLIGAHPHDDNRSITIEMTGEVRYNMLVRGNERRVGILFTKIEDKDKNILAYFVEKISMKK